MAEHFMQEAIVLAERSVMEGGGPFGAVVVKDGRVIGRGHNRVTLDNDPTAHAEVQAIRDACRTVGDYRLEGCTIYVSCLPCPMCFAAIYWGRLDRVYYAATAADAASIGFDDVYIAEELAKPPEARHLSIEQMMRSEALAAFAHWREKPDRIDY